MGGGVLGSAIRCTEFERGLSLTHKYMDIAFTEAVRAQQIADGSREDYARWDDVTEDRNGELRDSEAGFLAARDSFYMASVNADGWPYVQHRGGPRGFVRVLGPRQIGFADYRGNRQFVSVGNLDGDDRVSLFFMDYANKTRLKIFGHARVVALDGDMKKALTGPYDRDYAERAVVIDIAAFDWNCPKYITERYTVADIQASVAALQDRIVELETELLEIKKKRK